jgi:hypothetical protein
LYVKVLQRGNVFMRYGEHTAASAGVTTTNAETADRPVVLRGEALARDLWLEQFGIWIVICFIGLFTILLVVMNLMGQIPGKSFPLKDMSDILQTGGQWIGFFFCLRITLKLQRVASQLSKIPQLSESRQEIAIQREELHNTKRASWAWLFLAIGIACYGCAGIIWTSYDVRMPTSQIPYPGWYDIGYVVAYPFFLLGTILLARRSGSTAGRTRLLLDAFSIIGTSVALSWFFLLVPFISSLSQIPGPLAAVLAIYFPTGDLLLIVMSVLILFSPLSTREQAPVLLRLCLGLGCLTVADSLLGYFHLTSGFNTGTFLDVLRPLSLLVVGLAAIEYPRSVVREQEQEQEQDANLSDMQALLAPPTRLSQLSVILQAIIPIFLTLLTGALLLLFIAPRGHNDLIVASIIVLVLTLIVISRQALTLLENNRLTMQLREELVISRRELLVTQLEANKAEQLAQENQELTANIKEIQQAHTSIARGDFTAKAPQIKGPLLPLSISFNLMQERLNSLAQRTAHYDELLLEIQIVRQLVEQMRDRRPKWSIEQLASNSKTELRTVFLALADLQRTQNNDWHRLHNAASFLKARVMRLREIFTKLERMAILPGSEIVLEKTKLEGMQQTIQTINEHVEQIIVLLPLEYRQDLRQDIQPKMPPEQLQGHGRLSSFSSVHAAQRLGQSRQKPHSFPTA